MPISRASKISPESSLRSSQRSDRFDTEKALDLIVGLFGAIPGARFVDDLASIVDSKFDFGQVAQNDASGGNPSTTGDVDQFVFRGSEIVQDASDALDDAQVVTALLHGPEDRIDAPNNSPTKTDDTGFPDGERVDEFEVILHVTYDV